MSSLAVTGTTTNEAGLVAQFTGIINVIDPPVVNSVSVSPDPAVAGTLRTITIVATDPQGQNLTYTCKVNGVDATPVAGSPGVFTFTA
jgi:hypothetical protein